MTATVSRSLLKSITWRIVGTVSTVLLVYAFTQRLDLTVGFGVIDTIVKFVSYYMHERAWSHVGFGWFS